VSSSAKPANGTKALEKGGFWIEGKLESPAEGLTGPLVIGPDWLLEMIRTRDRTIGFYWARFAIINNFPLSELLEGQFVGTSMPGDPPASWLVTSMMFDLGAAPLATTPEALIQLVQQPRPHVTMETVTGISPLSRKAKDLIATNYRNDIAISVIARKLGISHEHLTRQFKRDFGVTPIGYRQRLRVTEAMGKLSKGESILDIGYDVGFNDTKRFYDDFRKVTGTSPGKCR
jgi:AraC-like DNA-binding protein